MRLQAQSNPPTLSTSLLYDTSKIVMPSRHTGHNGLLVLGGATATSDGIPAFLGDEGVWERRRQRGGWIRNGAKGARE